MKLRKLKVNFDTANQKKGDIVKVRCDDNGQPLSSYWRKMLKNAETDNCVEWVEAPRKTKKGDDK